MLEARPGGGRAGVGTAVTQAVRLPARVSGAPRAPSGVGGGVDRGSGLQAARGVQSSNPGLAYACLRLGFLPCNMGLSQPPYAGTSCCPQGAWLALAGPRKVLESGRSPAVLLWATFHMLMPRRGFSDARIRPQGEECRSQGDGDTMAQAGQQGSWAPGLQPAAPNANLKTLAAVPRPVLHKGTEPCSAPCAGAPEGPPCPGCLRWTHRVDM